MDTHELNTRGTLKRLLDLKLFSPPHNDSSEKHFVNKELCTDGANAVMRVSVLALDQQGLRASAITKATLYSQHGPWTRHTAGEHLILTTIL